MVSSFDNDDIYQINCRGEMLIEYASYQNDLKFGTVNITSKYAIYSGNSPKQVRRNESQTVQRCIVPIGS